MAMPAADSSSTASGLRRLAPGAAPQRDLIPLQLNYRHAQIVDMDSSPCSKRFISRDLLLHRSGKCG